MSDRDIYFARWARVDAENRRLRRIIDSLLDDRINHKYVLLKESEQVSRLEDEIERLKLKENKEPEVTEEVKE